MPEPITVSAIALHVGEIIIAEEVTENFIGKVYRYLFPKKYKDRLASVITQTLKQYERRHPYDHQQEKTPFFATDVLLGHLSRYILFKKGSLDEIKDEFGKHPNNIIPTQTELDEFYTLFINNIKADWILQNRFIDENYKDEIYSISAAINQMQSSLDIITHQVTKSHSIISKWDKEQQDKKLTPEKLLVALNSQVERQLKKQLSSGKYLPNTFIETGDQKDHLRYLCDCVFYSEKCFEEIKVMDFRLLNDHFIKKGLPAFDLDFEKFKLTQQQINVSKAVATINDWLNHLAAKQKEIAERRVSNLSSKFEYKFRDPIENLTFLKSRVALITEVAGQGKTNFLCDFCDNFLSKRGIPTVFLTGSEINPSDIRSSILKILFPNTNAYSFEELLICVRNVCYEQNKFFVIVIDGINENSNPLIFSKTIELFITEVLEFDFIRIVLSCRTEYYQQNFINLESSTFARETQRINSLLDFRPDNALKEKLFEIYFSYFNITYGNISSKAHDQLVSNFLLLRIFCETYNGQNLEFIDNIYKEELFEAYYTLKSTEINKRLLENDEFRITGTLNIRGFISRLVEVMVTSRKYVNVPLDKTIADPKDRGMYIRFLDENILVKRDLQIDDKGIFTQTEVVNFTFDEFRDFILSRFLVEELYPKSEKEFTAFIKSEISPNSPLLEGCSAFLFFISRRKTDQILNDILSKQIWFASAFSNLIFSLKDSQIDNNDKIRLKINLIDNSAFSKNIILNLIYNRYDVVYFKNLNIDFLFDVLTTLDEGQYTKCFSSKFTVNHFVYSGINQELLLQQIEELLKDGELKKDSKYHKLFELLLYMFNNEENWEIQALYERYFFQNNEIGKRQLQNVLKCNNKSLVEEVNNFIAEYEIDL